MVIYCMLSLSQWDLEVVFDGFLIRRRVKCNEWLVLLFSLFINFFIFDIKEMEGGGRTEGDAKR